MQTHRRPGNVVRVMIKPQLSSAILSLSLYLPVYLSLSFSLSLSLSFSLPVYLSFSLCLSARQSLVRVMMKATMPAALIGPN